MQNKINKSDRVISYTPNNLLTYQLSSLLFTYDLFLFWIILFVIIISIFKMTTESCIGQRIILSHCEKIFRFAVICACKFSAVRKDTV